MVARVMKEEVHVYVHPDLNNMVEFCHGATFKDGPQVIHAFMDVSDSSMQRMTDVANWLNRTCRSTYIQIIPNGGYILRRYPSPGRRIE